VHHAETIELVHSLFNRGDQVFVLTCRGALVSCAANPSHDRYLCFRCTLQSDYSSRNLLPHSINHLTLTLDAEVTQDNLLEFTSIQDFTNYTFEGVPLGRMALSQLVDDYSDVFLPLKVVNTKGITLIQNGQKLYLAAIDFFKTNKIQEVYVWNGRRVSEGPLLYAAKALGIEHFAYISGSEPNKYSLIKGLGVHSTSARTKYILEVLSDLSNSRDAVNLKSAAKSFYELQEFGVQRDLAARKFVDDKTFLPNGVFRTNRLIKLAVFTSSFWEWVGNPEHVEVPVEFQDPYKVIEKLLSNDQIMNNAEIVVRWHPNLRNAGEIEKSEMLRIIKISHPNVIHVMPESNQDSYQILDEADVVLTNGSTIGVEASYRRKPSILAGFAVYQGIGATHEPANFEQLVDLILSKPKAVGYREAVAFGAWLYTQGTSFKKVTYNDDRKAYELEGVPIIGKKPKLLKDKLILKATFHFKKNKSKNTYTRVIAFFSVKACPLFAKNLLRALVNLAIKLGGAKLHNGYIRFIQNARFGLSDNLRIKLLSLPEKISIGTVVDLGYCKFDYFTFPEDDLQLAIRSNLKYWEPRTLAYFFERARSARTILDIGGYTGIYSLVAAKANPDSKIHVFEPSYSTVEKLKQNIKLNLFDKRIEVHSVALSNGIGNLYSFLSERDTMASTNSVSRLSSLEAQKVNHVSLDSCHIENVDLIKIDVEGFESEVIQGAIETIRRYKPTIVMECLDQGELERIRLVLMALDYLPPLKVGESDGDEKNFIWLNSSH
jgi:FkbM family methyltransferase